MAALSTWRRATALASDLVAFALPQRCASCTAAVGPHDVLCRGCRAAIPRISVALCARCLVAGREPHPCAAHPEVTVGAAWSYDERAAHVVHALKYDGRTAVAAALGAELAAAVPPGFSADLVLAVPLHRTRRRERGYNQSALLAAALAAKLEVPQPLAGLERVRATAPQARLGPAARRRNLRGAFRVPRAASLRGRRVLLVDDVITTGATFEACLSVLAEAGAVARGVALAWAQ